MPRKNTRATAARKAAQKLAQKTEQQKVDTLRRRWAKPSDDVPILAMMVALNRVLKKTPGL